MYRSPVEDSQQVVSKSYKGYQVKSSLASLHLEKLISTACSVSTATSDQAELPSLKVEGLKWLALLLILFCEANDINLQNKMKLYLCGCESFLLILDLELINEASVLRRLFGVVLQANTEIIQ
jgi:hypothetical protein